MFSCLWALRDAAAILALSTLLSVVVGVKGSRPVLAQVCRRLRAGYGPHRRHLVVQFPHRAFLLLEQFLTGEIHVHGLRLTSILVQSA